MRDILVNRRFRITEILGTGGMAAVFLAKDEKLDVHRAIKVLAPEFSKLAQVRKRFISEATTMAKLQHPNVVTVFDFGDVGESLYIIMEIMDGGSLDDLIKEHQGLPYGQAAWITKEIIKGLTAAHEKGIIHRDMKPDNVLIGKGNVPKITDFGIASVQDENTRMTRAGAVMGTLNYMPPEQRIDSSKVSPQSDYYSVICTFFEMVTQKEPLDLYDEEARTKLLVDLPVELQRFIAKGTSSKPGDRHQSPEELFVELDEIVQLYQDEKFLQLYEPNTTIMEKLVTQVASNNTQQVYSKYTGEIIEPAERHTINSLNEVDSFDDSGADTFFFDDEEDNLQIPHSNVDTVIPKSTNLETLFDLHEDKEVSPSSVELDQGTSQNDDDRHTERQKSKNAETDQIPSSKSPALDTSIESKQDTKSNDSTGKGNSLLVLVGLAIVILIVIMFSMSSSQPEETQVLTSSPTNQQNEQLPNSQEDSKEVTVTPTEQPITDEKPSQVPVQKNESTDSQKENNKKISASSTKNTNNSTIGVGTLILSSKPVAKSILVDGVKKKSRLGKVEIKEIASGKHKIRFETVKGDTHTKTITVKKDKSIKYCWDFFKKTTCK